MKGLDFRKVADGSNLQAKERRSPIAQTSELSGTVPTSVNAKHYARRVKDTAIKRRVHDIGRETLPRANNGYESSQTFAYLRRELDARSGFPNSRLIGG